MFFQKLAASPANNLIDFSDKDIFADIFHIGVYPWTCDSRVQGE